jgi:hypothetical protein
MCGRLSRAVRQAFAEASSGKLKSDVSGDPSAHKQDQDNHKKEIQFAADAAESAQV